MNRKGRTGLVRRKLKLFVSVRELQTDRKLSYNGCTMRRLKSFLLILLALWLPLQAAASVTMPFCRHAMESMVTEEATSGHPCHQMADEVATLSADIACDNCEMCHLATAGYLLTTSEAVPPLVANILVPRIKPVLASHIPEPPQLPPRRLN